MEFNNETQIDACMREALLAIGDDIKREYNQAIRIHPDLVEKESRAIDFLSLENFDFDRAALRLCHYWKARKDLFGEERWLLPLTQTGCGALSPDDVELLRSGYFAVVIDRREQCHVLVDATRVNVLPTSASLRIRLYLLHLYREFTKNGAHFLHVITSNGKQPLMDFDALQAKDMETVRRSVPFNQDMQQIVVAEAFEAEKQGLLSYLSYQACRILEFRNGQRVKHVAGNSLAHTRSLLEGCGLDRNCLPRSLGGSYDYNQFHEWVRMRLTIEGAMFSAPLHVNRLSGVSAPILLGTCHDTARTNTKRLPQLANTEESPLGLPNPTKAALVQQQRRAKINSQRKFPLRKRKNQAQGETELKQQINTLELQKDWLRQDNRRLESYLAQARYVAAVEHQKKSTLSSTVVVWEKPCT